MLRPDTFVDQMKNKIPDDLLGILYEFLTDRKFFLEMNGRSSEVRSIDRGCPQGSVLGPVLFNLYTGSIANKIPVYSHLTSYADDSYVIVEDADLENLVRKTETCISTHIESLEAIGMKVNEDKTELILFGKDQPELLVNVKGTAIESKDQIKALGIIIDKEISWRPHVTTLKKKIMKVIGGVRIVRNKLTEKQATSIVTAQIFSILYYACSVWLTPSLNRKTLCRVESLHYRALRLILRDYRQRLSRQVVTEKTKRLPPDKWGKFSLASMFLNMVGRNEPVKLLRQISSNTYTKRRKPGFIYAFDSSETRVGRQMTKNWLGSALSVISSPWSDRNLSKDSVRLLLKKSYYNF